MTEPTTAPAAQTATTAVTEAASSGRARALYDLNKTAIRAYKGDTRFSYCLYVPPTAVEPGSKPDLIVAVHGTSRDSFLDFRNGFSEFGRWKNCVILCPLFPIGVLGDNNRGGYKFLKEGDIRYDEVLLGMVAEVEATYKVSFDRFALFGYSGGGHFTHRFFMLHPQRLWAASIGAPGVVTLLDQSRDWWVGVRNLRDVFGIDLNPEAMRDVAVHMVVGDADLETWEITIPESHPGWMPGANDAGATRPDRLRSLKKSFEEHGIAVQLDLVPGVSHDRMRCLDSVQNFFAKALDRKRASGG